MAHGFTVAKTANSQQIFTHNDQSRYTDEIMDPFGVVLAKALDRKGLTQSEFAKRANIARSVVCEVINGHRKPPVKSGMAWAAILGLPKAEREQWATAIALARADQRVRDLVSQLQEENERLQARAT